MSVEKSVIFDKKLLRHMKLGEYNFLKPLLNADLCKAIDHWGTLLHYAALYGSEYCITDLIKLGSDVNSLTRHGETALMISLQRNDDWTVRTLLTVNADIDMVGSDGLSALQLLFQSPLVLHPMVKYFFSKMQSETSTTKEIHQRLIDAGCTAYHAVHLGSRHILEALLERGTDVNSRDVHNRTALMAAADTNNLEMVTMLLDKGADVNALDDMQMSALHWTAIRKKKVTLQFLLNAGADVNAKVRYNLYTPLLYVFMHSYETTEEQADMCAELLLVHGALPQNSNDTTILNLASGKPNSYRTKLLIARIAMLDLMGIPIIESLTDLNDVEYHTEYPEFSEYHDLCQQVLMLPIFKSLTLLDFLNETENQMRMHVRNQQLMSEIADFHLEENLAERCPLYSKQIEKCISNAKRTLELENIAIPILFKILDASCHVVVRKIIDYLDKKDLENFCQIED